MQFALCENTGFFLRMGLIGPSGSGKTYTALKLATELGFERIGIIDTENRSARRYAKCFSHRFLSLELGHFSPRDYIAAIHAAEEAGLEVLIIDSLSHAWMGRGGVLEMVDQSARRQSRGGNTSSFNGWREVTPEHNRLVETLIQTQLHLIVTMRVKTDYVVEKDEKSGKSAPRKVGLAPVQREGLEYEFDIVGDLSPDHELAITKSRCPAVADIVVSKPGLELARSLRAWIDGADAVAAAPAAAESVAELAPEGLLLEEAAPGQVMDREGRSAAVIEVPAEAQAHEPAVLPAVRPVAPRPRAAPEPSSAEEIQSISPWLQRIHEVEEHGSEEQLDEVRVEMNASLKKRTRTQGEVLRRAIEMAKAAIRARARQQQLFQEREQGTALHSTG